MFDGSTSGRGFESALAPYAFGAIFCVTVVAWVWFEVLKRRAEREDAAAGKDLAGGEERDE